MTDCINQPQIYEENKALLAEVQRLKKENEKLKATLKELYNEHGFNESLRTEF